MVFENLSGFNIYTIVLTAEIQRGCINQETTLLSVYDTRMFGEEQLQFFTCH